MTSRLITLLENNTYRSYTKDEYDAMKKLPGNVGNPLLRNRKPGDPQSIYWSGQPEDYTFTPVQQSTFNAFQHLLTQFGYPFEYLAAIEFPSQGRQSISFVSVSPIMVWNKFSPPSLVDTNIAKLLSPDGKKLVEIRPSEFLRKTITEQIDFIKLNLSISPITNNSMVNKQQLETDEQQILYATSNKLGYRQLIDSGINPSEKVKLATVKKFPLAIEWMPDPSDELQLAAVKSSNSSKAIFGLIKIIKHPCYEFKKRIIEKEPYTIPYISGLTEELVKIALSKCSYALTDIISRPNSIKWQLMAVNNNGKTILQIKNPTPLVQSVACSNNPDAINCISPIESIDISLLKKYRDYLRSEQLAYLEKIEQQESLMESVDLNTPRRTLNGLTEEQQVEYVKLHQDDEPDHMLDDVIMDSDLSEAVILKILAINGNFLGCFEKPWSLIFQLAAVKSKPGSILMIENPASMIQWAAFQKSKSVIWDIYPQSCVLPEIIDAYNEWASKHPTSRKPTFYRTD